MTLDRKLLKSMMHSPVRNYAIPGLTSWMIGNPSPQGCMRLFECSRDHQENITPHSHRFDFQCWVLAGRVCNKHWDRNLDVFSQEGDQFTGTDLVYQGDVGHYARHRVGVNRYRAAEMIYDAGDWYAMKAADIHSISFSSGAEVLFFEGPTLTDTSTILEPYVDGQDVPTFQVAPWMFKREAA